MAHALHPTAGMCLGAHMEILQGLRSDMHIVILLVY